MFTETRKVFALAALIVATGVVTVELAPSSAQAGTMTRAQAYAAARVDTAFDLVATMPATAAVMVPMAQKGDLPVPLGCTGVQGDAQAECMDVAYEVPSEPSVVVETREGTTSTLLRMDAMTVAGMTDTTLMQSE
jgi:hypothetical protein